MTVADALRAILADGARSDDPRWPQVGAAFVRDCGSCVEVLWPGKQRGEGLQLLADSRGWQWHWWDGARADSHVGGIADGDATFYAHLARMTEGR